MLKRQLIALIALFGILIAVYLTLYKVGAIAELNCAVGSCETVQFSRWANLFGLPVAAWGIVFYVVLLALALASLQARWIDSRAMSLALVAWTSWGVLFSAWLTFLELFVIHAICQWCVVSALLIVIAFVTSAMDLRGRSVGAAGAVGGASRSSG